MERLTKDFNKFFSENASGGRPRFQSVAARGPTNGSTNASGGKPRSRSVAARGPANGSTNASDGRLRSQSVVVGSTGGAESVSDGEHRANERYVVQTSAALAGDAKNVVNPDQVQGARDFFEKLGIGTGAPGDSLTSGQVNTAKIAGIFSAKRNFNANHLKTVGRFNVAVGNFDNSMKSLKLQMDDKGLQQRVVLNLGELKSALDSMNSLQRQLEYSYLDDIGDDVRSGLERNLGNIEKIFRESHAIFDDLFKDQIKNIENMGKVIKELQENPLFVAQGDRLGALGQKF